MNKDRHFVTVWTNNLYADKEAMLLVCENLIAGHAVHVDSACIGSTRGNMVVAQGAEYMKRLGAKEVDDYPEGIWMKPAFKL